MATTSYPSSSSQQEDAKERASTLNCLQGTAIALVILSLIVFVIFCAVNSPEGFDPEVFVVSAFVSRINVTDESRLTATWAIVLEVHNGNQEFDSDTIQSGVFQVGNSRNLLAMTRRFATNRPDVAERTHRVRQAVAIQIKADGEAVPGLDSREMEEANRAGSSEFGFLALVWVHIGPVYFFPRKNYFARFTCHPLWIGSSAEQAGGDVRGANPRKCHVAVFRQKYLDKNWTRFDMT